MPIRWKNLEHFKKGLSMERIGYILAILLLGVSVCFGQTKQDDSTSLNIITKVTFHGQYYFIRITPIDKGNRDHMPMFGNKSMPKQNTIFWKDSLQHMLPDSIIHRLNDLYKLKLK
jgi:hypothetical protein